MSEVTSTIIFGIHPILEAFEAGKTPYDIRAMCAQLGPSNYIVLGDAVLARDFLTVKAEA